MKPLVFCGHCGGKHVSDYICDATREGRRVRDPNVIEAEATRNDCRCTEFHMVDESGNCRRCGRPA